MYMTKTKLKVAVLLTSIVVCGTLAAQPRFKDALSKLHTKPPVNARLVMHKANSEELLIKRVTLIGRDGDILLAQEARSVSRLTRIHKDQIIQCEFYLNYNTPAVANAIRAQDWATAVRILAPVVRLTLPYLDLAENDGLELAMDLGMYMVASADRELRVATHNDASRERAHDQYDAAFKLFTEAGKADWSPFGQVAILKGCRTLIAQGQTNQASEIVGTIDELFPGDAAYGHYWLAQAELLDHAEKTADALDAVVKSVVFADKDVETFPSALLLSAKCYSKLELFHRARDIYYEVAVLFIGTDWAIEAEIELATIMDGKKTIEEEKSPIENVFFNVSDDMNKLSEELLEKRGRLKTKPDATEKKKDS